MDLNKYLNNVAPSEPQYSKEEYAAMKKTEREAVWAQVDARMGEVLADAPALQEFLNFMSQSRNSLPNQLLLSGQNADITDARTFQQWKDAGRHIRTGEEGYTAIVGQVYENNGRKASGYNIGKVFDITQTRGRPIPPPAEYQVDELIAATIESSPVPIQISDSLPDGIQAQYVPKNRTIYVRNGMDEETGAIFLVNETSHFLYENCDGQSVESLCELLFDQCIDKDQLDKRTVYEGCTKALETLLKMELLTIK